MPRQMPTTLRPRIALKPAEEASSSRSKSAAAVPDVNAPSRTVRPPFRLFDPFSAGLDQFQPTAFMAPVRTSVATEFNSGERTYSTIKPRPPSIRKPRQIRRVKSACMFWLRVKCWHAVACLCWFAFQCAALFRATVLALRERPIPASFAPLVVYIYAVGGESCRNRLTLERSARLRPKTKPRSAPSGTGQTAHAFVSPFGEKRDSSRALHPPSAARYFVGRIPPPRLARDLWRITRTGVLPFPCARSSHMRR